MLAAGRIGLGASSFAHGGLQPGREQLIAAARLANVPKPPANDHTAALLIRNLEQAGAHVPRSVRVVGFDDAKFATLVSVPLTTIRQPCRDIAVTAFRAMLERLADPTLPTRNILLRPRLVVRESCGVYLKKSR